MYAAVCTSNQIQPWDGWWMEGEEKAGGGGGGGRGIKSCAILIPTVIRT